jgi:hypothetical protein
MILVVIGATLAAGWGGRLFLGWRRRRLL